MGIGAAVALIKALAPATNPAEIEQIEEDVSELKTAISEINEIIGNQPEHVITLPTGYKSASFSNSSQTRVFKYENEKLHLKVARSTTGSLSQLESTTTDASLTINDSLAFALTENNTPLLKCDYVNNVAPDNAVLVIRFYNAAFANNIGYSYVIPSGEGTLNIDIKAIAMAESINITTYPNVVIRSLTSRAHTAIVVESTELFVYGFQTTVQSETINTRVDTLENDVENLDEKVDNVALMAEEKDTYDMRKDIPSYYLAYPSSPVSFDEQEYLEERIKKVPEGNSFIYVTDTHWEANNKHTFDLIRYVKARLGISKVVFGGDLIDREDTKYKGLNVVREFMSEAVNALGTDFLPVVGNHDTNMGNVIESGLSTATYRIPYNYVYESMISHLEGKAVFEDLSAEIASVAQSTADAEELTGWSKLHYYIDDVENKTRYIMIYSSCPDDAFLPNYTGFASDGGGGPSTVMQIDWFADTMVSTPEGYDVVVVAHCADSESKTFPDRQQLRSYFEHFVHIASAVHQKSTGYKINISNFDENTCPSNAFWTRETKQWDFSNAPTLGKIVFIAGHIHRNVEYVTRIDTPSASNPTFEKGKARNNGNPALVGIEEGVQVFDSATVDFASGEIVTIITQTDAYQRTTSQRYPYELGSMTVNTDTDQCFDVITLTNTGIVCTRFGAGWDRAIPVTWN